MAVQCGKYIAIGVIFSTIPLRRLDIITNAIHAQIILRPILKNTHLFFCMLVSTRMFSKTLEDAYQICIIYDILNYKKIVDKTKVLTVTTLLFKEVLIVIYM